jgi:hypothetical protein
VLDAAPQRHEDSTDGDDADERGAHPLGHHRPPY